MSTEQVEKIVGRWHVAEDPRRAGRWCVLRYSGSGYSAKHAGSQAEAEATFAEMAAKGECRECGDVLNDAYMEPYRARIRETRQCMHCLFWADYVTKTANPASVRVGGEHYWIEPDRRVDSGCLGHGGAEFSIRFSDGREVVSHNLWAQGPIPAHFRERIPDNAEFLQRGHRAVGNLQRGGGGYVGAGSADSAVEP